MSMQGVKLHLVEDFEDATKFMNWLATTNTERLALDTEGEGLNVRKDKVRLIQFGDRTEGWALPMDRWNGLAIDVVKRWAASGRRFVAHNARYDCAMLEKHDVHVPRHLVDDTLFMAAVADPSVPIGLKPQSARHIDPRAASAQGQLDSVMHSGGWNWATIPVAATGPVASYWQYASLDVVLTSRLWDHHAPNVMRDSPRAYDTELAVGWIASDMEAAGVLCDREYTSQQQDEFYQMYNDLTARVRSEFGVDAGSKDQIIQALLRDGVQFTKHTAGGSISLDKEVLETINHPLVHLISQRRKIEKLGSTYLRRFMEYSEDTGRIHASINTVGGSGKTAGESGGMFGVRTGRMSLSNPNLQQLPRGNDPLSSVIRNCIVAEEGKTLVMCDFDQIELRLMAHLSQDPGLAEAFKSEDDFFTSLARSMYRDDMIEKKDPRRQNVKSTVYGTLYGAGADKIATTAGISLTESQETLDKLFGTYPGIKTFQNEVQRVAMQRRREEGKPYVRSPLTNRKFIGEQGKEYKLVNTIIQASAAEMFKTKLLELDAAGLGEFMRLPIHDEIMLEVPNEALHDVTATLSEVMNDATMFSVPITAGLATATRWGEKQDV